MTAVQMLSYAEQNSSERSRPMWECVSLTSKHTALRTCIGLVLGRWKASYDCARQGLTLSPLHNQLPSRAVYRRRMCTCLLGITLERAMSVLI